MSGDCEQTEQFDSLFLTIAQHHPKGATQVSNERKKKTTSRTTNMVSMCTKINLLITNNTFLIY